MQVLQDVNNFFEFLWWNFLTLLNKRIQYQDFIFIKCIENPYR